MHTYNWNLKVAHPQKYIFVQLWIGCICSPITILDWIYLIGTKWCDDNGLILNWFVVATSCVELDTLDVDTSLIASRNTYYPINILTHVWDELYPHCTIHGHNALASIGIGDNVTTILCNHWLCVGSLHLEEYHHHILSLNATINWCIGWLTCIMMACTNKGHLG